MKQKNTTHYHLARKEVIQRYSALGSGVKSYVSSRFLLGGFHYTLLERHLPDDGYILDYGCGFGQLSILLKLTGNRRVIYGYDYSQERTSAARKAAEDLSDTYFLHNPEQIPKVPWKAIIFCDMLHYMPHSKQDALVLEYANSIEPGGLLVIRDVNRNFTPRYLFNSLQERIFVGAGITLTKVTRAVYFRNLNDFRELLTDLGFQTQITPPPWYHPYADYLFIARKTHN